MFGKVYSGGTLYLIYIPVPSGNVDMSMHRIRLKVTEYITGNRLLFPSFLARFMIPFYRLPFFIVVSCEVLEDHALLKAFAVVLVTNHHKSRMYRLPILPMIIDHHRG